MSTLGERIKEIRKKSKAGGMNQLEFGAVIGVQQSTVAGWENDSRTPNAAIIKAICEKFHVDELWLRTGKGKQPSVAPERARLDEAAAIAGKAMAGADPRYRAKLVELIQTTPPEIMDACILELLRWAKAIEEVRQEIEEP